MAETRSNGTVKGVRKLPGSHHNPWFRDEEVSSLTHDAVHLREDGRRITRLMHDVECQNEGNNGRDLQF